MKTNFKIELQERIDKLNENNRRICNFINKKNVLVDPAISRVVTAFEARENTSIESKAKKLEDLEDSYFYNLLEVVKKYDFLNDNDFTVLLKAFETLEKSY